MVRSMEMGEFAERVSKGVTAKAGGALDVRVTENPKNNGATRTAITMMGPGGGLSIYLDRYYEGYEDGVMDIDGIAGEVYTQLMEHKDDLKGVDIAGISKWEMVEGHIYARLVNAGMNREALAGMPHRQFLDLAVSYYVEMDGIARGDSTAGFLIKNGHMEAWGQDEGGLYQAARSNMRLSGGPVFEDMDKVLQEQLQGGPPPAGLPGLDMYILTNQRKLFGAAEILDGGTLKWIGDKLGGDYVVLPSSVHETLILPSDGRVPYRELADIVWEVNRAQVIMEERLSDHVYLYERGKGALRIVA